MPRKSALPEVSEQARAEQLGTLNKLMLVGNVGRDPDKHAINGSTVSVSLATTEHGQTQWHRLIMRGEIAQRCFDYVRKGDRLYVEGWLHYDSFEKNGMTIPTVEVIVTQLVMLAIPRGFGS